MQDLIQTIPVELVEKILSLIDSPQDLRSLSLSARYAYDTVKRHADYRHIRCSLTQGETAWEMLAADKSLAANVRILEIQPETSKAPSKAMLLPATLYTPPKWNSSHFLYRAEAKLTTALPNLINLITFRWASHAPTIGEVYDSDMGAILRQYGLEEKDDGISYGEEMWLVLITLKALCHVEIRDIRLNNRFPFDTSPLWSMRGLTSFTFIAKWGDYEYSSDPFDLFELAEMLGVGCPALESLDITSDVFANRHTCEDVIPPEESRGDMFLGPYVWPHLRTLKLSGIGCSSTNARIFLRNHPGIETLIIGRHFGLDMDEYEENYTDWDNTPYLLDTLPNLRSLITQKSEQSVHILLSPTTLPRPIMQMRDIISEHVIIYLRDLPHISRLDFKQCNLINLVNMASNTVLSSRLRWLDLGHVQHPRGDDWFSAICPLIAMLGVFPNLVVFHGIELIRPDGPIAQNASIAAGLLHTCPKLRRIDAWHKYGETSHTWFRGRDKDSYVALSPNNAGLPVWKICKMDEWEGDEFGGVGRVNNET